jgi:hypothetical protein
MRPLIAMLLMPLAALLAACALAEVPEQTGPRTATSSAAPTSTLTHHDHGHDGRHTHTDPGRAVVGCDHG